jgi:hypothetical protein
LEGGTGHGIHSGCTGRCENNEYQIKYLNVDFYLHGGNTVQILCSLMVIYFSFSLKYVTINVYFIEEIS